MILRILLLACIGYGANVKAETMVLVQGFLAGGENWRNSGFTGELARGGWSDGGHLRATSQGMQLDRDRVAGNRRFFTLDLPSDSSLKKQAAWLDLYVGFVREKYPEESLILVGHSAGGVLARLYMVQHPKAGVDALITIASPHLGTESAQLGLMIGRQLPKEVAPLLDSILNRSLPLFSDLSPENASNLLGWLNRQPHPPANYVSIVRGKSDTSGMAELLVPIHSQDMNQVFALRGQAQTIESGRLHGLRREDARVVLQILIRSKQV